MPVIRGAELPAPMVWHRAFADAPVAIGICDEDGRFVAVNTALAQLLARPVEQLVGRPVLTFVHPADRPGSLAAYFEADVAAAAGVRRGHRRLRCLSGTGAAIPVAISWTITEPDGFGSQHGVVYLNPDPTPGCPAR